MVRIAIGINYFLEAENIKACLESLRIFEKVYCIDGRCTHFDYPRVTSDDGSFGIIASYSNTVNFPMPKRDQVEKRNKYLEMAQDVGFDWVLQVDADETVHVDHDVLSSALSKIPNDVPVVNVMYHDMSESYPWGRLIRPSLVRYYELHHILRQADGTEYDMVRTPGECIEGLMITHHKHDSDIHKRGKRAYRTWKQPYENHLRKKRGIPIIVGREV